MKTMKNMFISCDQPEASQVALVVKNPPANSGNVRDTGVIPGGEDPLEKEMATHSSILAWRISGTEEPGELQSMGLQRDSMRTQSCSSLLLTRFSFPSCLQQLFPRFYVFRQGSFSSHCEKKKIPMHPFTLSLFPLQPSSRCSVVWELPTTQPAV